MEPPSTHSVSILNQSGRRIPRTLIARAVASALTLSRVPASSVSILMTDDEGIRDLNRRFRQMDEATDVLTFPAGDFPNAPLGDIAISVPYAERQARARKVSLAQELGYLAIHGALHLVGLEDESEVDRAEMVSQMNRAAVLAGLRPDDEWASILHASLDGEDGVP